MASAPHRPATGDPYDFADESSPGPLHSGHSPQEQEEDSSASHDVRKALQCVNGLVATLAPDHPSLHSAGSQPPSRGVVSGKGQAHSLGQQLPSALPAQPLPTQQAAVAETGGLAARGEAAPRPAQATVEDIYCHSPASDELRTRAKKALAEAKEDPAQLLQLEAQEPPKGLSRKDVPGKLLALYFLNEGFVAVLRAEELVHIQQFGSSGESTWAWVLTARLVKAFPRAVRAKELLGAGFRNAVPSHQQRIMYHCSPAAAAALRGLMADGAEFPEPSSAQRSKPRPRALHPRAAPAASREALFAAWEQLRPQLETEGVSAAQLSEIWPKGWIWELAEGGALRARLPGVGTLLASAKAMADFMRGAGGAGKRKAPEPAAPLRTQPKRHASAADGAAAAATPAAGGGAGGGARDDVVLELMRQMAGTLAAVNKVVDQNQALVNQNQALVNNSQAVVQSVQGMTTCFQQGFKALAMQQAQQSNLLIALQRALPAPAGNQHE